MTYRIFTKLIRVVRIPLPIYFLRKVLELSGKNRRIEYIHNNYYYYYYYYYYYISFKVVYDVITMCNM